MQLSFEEKSVVTRVLLQKLCAYLVRDERKERNKGNLVIVSLKSILSTTILSVYFIK